MSLKGKKITLTDATPVQVIEAGPKAYELIVKSSQRMYVGSSPSMTPATGFPIGSAAKRFLVPAGVDMYVMLPGPYPSSFQYLALPFDGPTGQLSCARLSLTNVPTPLHAVSQETLLVEVLGFVRIGAGDITASDGFEAGQSPTACLVEPGEQLFAVESAPGAEAYAVVSTYIAR